MRSTDTESWLASENVVSDFLPNCLLTRINRDLSRRNNSRFEPFLEATIKRYAMAMRDGADFPAVIAHGASGKGLVLIDGNQRVAATERAAIKTIDCYIVRTSDPQVIDRLTRTANLRNGQPPTPFEALIHAKHFVQQYGLQIKDVAALFYLEEHDVGEAVRLEMIDLNLGRLGIPPEKMSRGMRLRLHPITNDSVLRNLGDLIVSTGYSVDRVAPLLAAIQASRSEQEQLAHIHTFRNRPEVQSDITRSRKGKIKGMAVRSARLFRSISEITNLLEKYPTADLLQLSPEDVERVNVMWSPLLGAMLRITGDPFLNGKRDDPVLARIQT